MKITILGAAAAASALLLVAGCSEKSDSTSSSSSSKTLTLAQCQAKDLPTKTSGSLTVATDDPAYDPWFSDDKPANGKGYESAVAYAVAKKLGFAASDVTWVKAGFNQVIQPGTKSFDFDINQVSITAARKKAVDFSSPYYTAKQAIITLKSSKYADATSLADLKGAKIGAQVGTTSLDAISQIDPTHKALVYDDTTKAGKALEAKQVDAIVADVPTAYYLTSAEIDGSKIVGQFSATADADSDQFGLVLSKGSKLTPCVDLAVDALQKDGTLDTLQTKWLSTATHVPELK